MRGKVEGGRERDGWWSGYREVRGEEAEWLGKEEIGR